MCNICRIPNRNIAYPAFQFVADDGSLVADGKSMAVCAANAKERATKSGWTIRLEPRQEESNLPAAWRLANDAVYAAAAAL